MKRTAYNKLLEWKRKPDGERKPLILQGARQVGKTWLLEEFGRNEFESVALINFEEQQQFASLFENDFNVDRILSAVQLAADIELIPGRTLIIFDEIQEAKRGILSLKYFYKNAPQYHIVAAGSLLGVSLHNDNSFPVGKVEFATLYPLSFEEFATALGCSKLVKTLHSGDWSLITAFKDKYTELLRLYYFVGGMPEVVDTFVKRRNFNEVRKVQQNLLTAYEKDFSKHPPVGIIPRIRIVWDNIPSQLAKENKKFVYSAIRKGSRAKDFEEAIEWLKDAGAVYKITRISNASLPIKGFEDLNAFKLYTLDVGLLGAMSGLDAKTIIDGNTIFTQYKGALSEQYVLQQLICSENIHIHYWTPDTGIAEVDFVIQIDGKIIPVEVKAEENLKAKSLKSYRDKYSPAISIRTSLSDFREQRDLINLPLYAISMIKNITQKPTTFDDAVRYILEKLDSEFWATYEKKKLKFNAPKYNVLKNQFTANVLNLISVEPHTIKDIFENGFDIKDDNISKEQYLDYMENLGLIVRTIKDRRSHSLQKYIITEKGRLFLLFLLDRRFAVIE